MLRGKSHGKCKVILTDPFTMVKHFYPDGSGVFQNVPIWHEGSLNGFEYEFFF